ncbi:hypothetical protein ACTHAM_001356 [Cellulomonas soli]|uniref:hypothetical protein n=1 Tax=Cellulomonas soli TaxID=931535 RepID=UPI003F834B9F
MTRQKPPSRQVRAKPPALDAVRATSRARLAVWVAVGGWCVGVLGAALLARDPNLPDLRWGLAFGSRGGDSVLELHVSRVWVVPFAALVMTVPIAMAAAAVMWTRELACEVPSFRGQRLRPSRWCTASMGAVLALLPNVLGCYAVSRHHGSPDVMVLLMLWPQFTFLVFVGAAMWRWEARRLRR